jgi:AsmA-like C-terminal region
VKDARKASRKWLAVLGFVLAVIFVAGGIALWRGRHMDDAVRLWVIHSLSEHFASRVGLASLRVTGFPHLGVAGEDLTIYFHDRTDVPPLIHVDKFSFDLGLIALLRLPNHISSAKIESMTITIPPRAEKKTPKSDSSGKKNTVLSALIVDEVICKNTVLITLPRKPGPDQPQKEPLEWDIHDLDLHDAGIDKPFRFHGSLTNGKPKGEIDTRGDFGPWDLDDPGATPVAGSYKFTDADLGPFPGIAGILSSTGEFTGELSELQVNGETDTPNFSLDKVGKPVPLHTEFSATVDGTNGDTLLHPVRATLIHSLIIAEGSVINEPGHVGHRIELEVGAPEARIQDVLSLAMDSEQPILTGPAKITAKLVLPPGKEKVLDKMILDGQIGVDDARWSSPEVRESLKDLSRRAEGNPKDADAGSAVSDLRGKFHVEKGIVTFSNLTFSIPGAAIDLSGTYQLVRGKIDLSGHLRLKAKLSQTVTGAKSFFLKLLDPFFEKNGAGAVVPISIGGTREHPTVGVSIFHKTINKKIGTSNSALREE